MLQFWSSLGILVTFGLALDGTSLVTFALEQTQQVEGLQARLLDKCCQVGRERATESAKFNCKLSAREALITGQTSGGETTSLSQSHKNGANLLALSADSLLASDQNFADQCEMVLESCCLALHRTRNCDSGKQFAKSGTSCMDVELSKEATVATESFNDCCMSCSLGILAARNPSQNDTTNSGLATGGDRCKLISPLASSLSGQLYEQTYTECCRENLPRLSGSLVEPGTPIDCAQANSCSQRCLSRASLDPITRRPIEQDRCDCYSGYRLASDEVTCVDIDECKLDTHTCDRRAEICDNTRGSFRCLARSMLQPRSVSSQQLHHGSFHQTNSQQSLLTNQQAHHHHDQQQQQHHHHHHHQMQQHNLNNNNRQDPESSSEHHRSELAERPFSSLRLRPPAGSTRW